VGWKGAPTSHGHWPEADPEWLAGRYFREFVAEVDGVIAARVGLEAYRPPFAQLVDLCVRPEYRRLGLGEQLTRACQEEATRRSFSALFLQTELDNSAAHRLYTSLGFVPTAYGKMLRMVKFLDYPLIEEFRRAHPLSQYWCTAVKDTERAWDLEWHAYITEDYLRLRLQGGSTQSDSDGVGPALTGMAWRVGQGARQLNVRLQTEAARYLEPGDHVALDITVQNSGNRMEGGVFQMILPPGVEVSSPQTNQSQVFAWEAAPGEEITQPLVLQIDPTFDAGVHWHLNYGSLPVCMETYWEGHRALLSTALHLAVPPP
jgi:GNAT superfamily N-acetyltransferase